MIDRRIAPRIVEESNVVVTVLDSPSAPTLAGKKFFCRTGNISTGGIMIYVSSAVPQGATLSLQVAFTKPIRAFQLTGKVAWTAPSGPDNVTPIGVEFTSGKGRDLETWKQIVNQKAHFHGAEIVDDPTNQGIPSED
ncbi:MAG: PilZ domain-containing protein [Kiritimatiellae bacterium]|nr:PilZ domain-containing protein [Kiritimatiellia bacterium]